MSAPTITTTVEITVTCLPPLEYPCGLDHCGEPAKYRAAFLFPDDRQFHINHCGRPIMSADGPPVERHNRDGAAMTAPEIVAYAFIGGLLAFAAITLISLLLIMRWLRNAPDPADSINHPPAARPPYVNGKTAEKERSQ